MQASDTRWRYIFQATDIKSTYRNQSKSSSQTDSEGCLDVPASCIGVICGMIPSCHGNTSADVTNNQTQIIQLNFCSINYGIMYVMELEYKKVRKILNIYISQISLVSLISSHSLRYSYIYYHRLYQRFTTVLHERSIPASRQ